MDYQAPTGPLFARLITSRPGRKKRRDTSRTQRDIRLPSTKPRATRATQPNVQELIGAFRLLERVPDAGSNELHLAERLRPGAPSARVLLELVRRESPSFDADKEILLARAAMLASDAHPNWVSLIDAGEEEEGAYFAVEQVEGTTLEKLSGHLRKKHLAMPIEIACFLIVEVLRGVHAAIIGKSRSPGIEIILREIVPTNVLISKTGQIKLSQAAFVAALAPSSSATVRTSDRPSYAYLAPEVVEKAEFTSRSAIYSAGAIFYELLGGSVLFEGANHYQVVASVLERGISARELAREGVPEELISVVARATHPKPLERFAKASDMADAIEAWLIDAGRALTPSAIERYFREPMSANAVLKPRRVRGTSAVIKRAEGEPPSPSPPPPPPIDRKPKAIAFEKRRVRERRAQQTPAVLDGVPIVVGTPVKAERVPSLAPVKFRRRGKARRPPRIRAKPRPRRISARIVAELILFVLALGAAICFYAGLIDAGG